MAFVGLRTVRQQNGVGYALAYLETVLSGKTY